MKILFFSKRFYPEIGGVEKHVYKISKEFLAKGHKVTVIAELGSRTKTRKISNYQSRKQSDTHSIKPDQTVKSRYYEQFVYEGINVIKIDFGEDNWFKKFRVWSRILKEKARVKESDVIHCHDVFFWYLPFRLLFPRKKVYTTFHGYESYPIRSRAIIVRKISELLSTGTICVGNFMKKWYFAKPDFVIYGGVDIPIKNNVVRKPSAFFWGRLDEQTGILEYCKTVKIVRQNIQNFEFVVAGGGKYLEKVRKYGKVLGFVRSPENKLKNYRFAFVSRYLSILEALAERRMVFALYDNKIKEDYLRLTPFAKYIYISGSPEELAKEVQFYCSNNKIEQERVNQGYKWVKNQSWKKVSNTYETLWRFR